MDIKKTRKIVLLSILGLAIVAIILKMISNNSRIDFLVWAYDKYATGSKPIISMDKPDKITKMISAGIMGIIGLIFILFALIYMFSSKNKQANLRKWPYIVMIISAVIGIGMVVFGQFISKHATPVTLTDQLKRQHPNLEKELIAEWNASYKNSVIALSSVSIVITLIALGLKSFMLVLIKKQKANDDVAFSETVKASAKPVSAATKVKPKAKAKPKDLP